MTSKVLVLTITILLFGACGTTSRRAVTPFHPEPVEPCAVGRVLTSSGRCVDLRCNQLSERELVHGRYLTGGMYRLPDGRECHGPWLEGRKVGRK